MNHTSVFFPRTDQSAIGQPSPSRCKRVNRSLTPRRIKTYNRRSRCGCVRFRVPQGFFSEIGRVIDREEDVSTEAHPAQTRAWISQANAHTRRSSGARRASTEGSLGDDCLGREEADAALSRAMIARPLRLRRAFEFDRVRGRGRSWTTPLVVLAVLPNNLETNRYGFAVGRRVGGAVRRNKIKRWFREATREFHPQLEQGFDIVVIARGRLASDDVTFEHVRDALRTLCRKAGLMANASQ
jgi:ribonuclease P protein component